MRRECKNEKDNSKKKKLYKHLNFSNLSNEIIIHCIVTPKCTVKQTLKTQMKLHNVTFPHQGLLCLLRQKRSSE